MSPQSIRDDNLPNILRMSFMRICVPILLATCLSKSVYCHAVVPVASASLPSSSSSLTAEHRAIDSSSFIDYNNSVWTPIGPGDPLNKDPTYDYSPPVLDRVRYWAETTATGSSMAAKPAAIPYSSYQHNNPHSNVVHKTKSDILLLGVPAMKRAQFKHVDAVETYAQPGQGQAPPRRNFYAQLPTVLMPPPMQTLSKIQHRLPTTGNPMHWPMSSAMLNTPDSYHQASGLYINVVEPSSLPTERTTSTTAHQQPQQQQLRKKPWIQALLQKEVTSPTRHTGNIEPMLSHAAAAAQNAHHYTTPSASGTVSMVPSTTVFESHTTRLSGHSVPPKSVTTSTTTGSAFADILMSTRQRPQYPTAVYKLGTDQGPSYLSHSTPMHSLSNHIIDASSVAEPVKHQQHVFQTTTAWETTTHFTPTIRPYAMSSLPPVATSSHHTSMSNNLVTIDTMRPQYKPSVPHLAAQRQQHTIGPAYVIIEGHSKVKTYGNSPAGRHEPNVRPVQSTVDPVVRTVLHHDAADDDFTRSTADDEEQRFQVRHLHYKQPATPEQRADALQQTTAAEIASHTLEVTTSAPTSGATETTEEAMTTIRPTKSDMSGLLSLLDTSFGDFFTDNETTDDAAERTTVTSSTEAGNEIEQKASDREREVLKT